MAESLSTETFETCFLLKNDGKGSDLGDGNIENADPAYSRLLEEITRGERERERETYMRSLTWISFRKSTVSFSFSLSLNFNQTRQQ